MADDDRALLAELLEEVRGLREEVRILRGVRGEWPRKTPRARRRDVAVSDTDRARARAAARRLGLVVHDEPELV